MLRVKGISEMISFIIIKLTSLSNDKLFRINMNVDDTRRNNLSLKWNKFFDLTYFIKLIAGYRINKKFLGNVLLSFEGCSCSL